MSTKDLPASSELTKDQLELARKMAAAGCKPELIRQALGGIPPSEWKRLRAPSKTGDPSDLALALETGKADLAHEVVSFFLAKMRKGDIGAARWLGERVCKFRDEEEDRTPKIAIVINSPMSPAEFMEVQANVADED